MFGNVCRPCFYLILAYTLRGEELLYEQAYWEYIIGHPCHAPLEKYAEEDAMAALAWYGQGTIGHIHLRINQRTELMSFPSRPNAPSTRQHCAILHRTEQGIT